MRIGTIDVGTNSVHLLIADIAPDGRVTVVEKQRVQVELGAGEFDGDTRRLIAPDAWRRGLETLRTYKVACDAHGCEDIHVAATSAVREAQNGIAFCDAVRDDCGLHVRVISGHDEGRLVWLGARSEIDFSRGRALLFDLGGGSTEFVLCDAEQALVIESLPIGHIRLAERYLHADPIQESDRRALKQYVQKMLQPLQARVRPGDFTTLIGISGTIRTLARIAAERRGELVDHGHGLVLRRADLDEIYRVVCARPSSQWALPSLDDRRRRTLPIGVIIVREFLKVLQKDQVLTSERSLRDGLVYDWILRHRPEIVLSQSVADPRRRSALALIGRCQADTAHGDQVTKLALAIFDATQPLHQGHVDERRALEFASLLHDIGHFIDGKEHHRHGQYLIRHARMPGFTAPEVNLLGNIVRYHRGGRPKVRDRDFQALPLDDRDRVRRLSAILRLADAFDRAHDQNVVTFDATLEGRMLTLDARVRGEGELEHWAAVQRADSLAEALEVEILIRVERV